MNFQIKKISQNVVVLMTEQGHVLANFQSLLDALSFCEMWYQANANERGDYMSIGQGVVCA